MKVLMNPTELKKYQDELTQKSVEKALAEAMKNSSAAPVRKATSDPADAYDNFHRDGGEQTEFDKSFSIAKFIRGKVWF